MSPTYGDAHFVLDGANKIESGELHSKGASVRVSRVSTTFLIVMHPRRETQVMHFIARFNSSVRLFNQTSLPALVLNVGGCDPFRRERTGMKTISSAESDLALSALRTLSARRCRRRVTDKTSPITPDTTLTFPAICRDLLRGGGGDSPRRKISHVFISTSRNNMPPIAIGPLLVPPCLYSENHCRKVKSLVRFNDDTYLSRKRQSSLFISTTIILVRYDNRIG